MNFLPLETPGESEFFERGGPPAVPGTYKVAVTVNGQTQMRSVQMEPDPRYPFDREAARAQTGAALEARAWVSAVAEALNRSESLKSQIATVRILLTAEEEPGKAAPAAYAPVVQQAGALEKALKGWEEKVYNTEEQPDGLDLIHHLELLYDRVRGLQGALSSPYNQAPSPLLAEEMNEVRQELDQRLAEFNGLLKNDVAAFNKMALEHGANSLFAGEPIAVKTSAASAGTGH